MLASNGCEQAAPAFSLPDPADAALSLATEAGPRAITPDTPREVVLEIARSPRFQKLKEAALRINAQRAAAMQRRMTAIGQEQQRRTYKAADGIGTLHMRVDLEHLEKMRVQYGASTWDDPEFLEWYRQRFSYCRVETSRGTRGQEYAGHRKAGTRI